MEADHRSGDLAQCSGQKLLGDDGLYINFERAAHVPAVDDVPVLAINVRQPIVSKRIKEIENELACAHAGHR
jgi:hypothetical protein